MTDELTDEAAVADDYAARRLRYDLIADLTAKGHMPREWRAVFETVPRHPFVPGIFVQYTNDGFYTPLDAARTRAEWLRAVYTDDVCVTQLNGGDQAWEQALRDGTIRGDSTCSSSQPSLMATMLAALDIQDGHRVLEVGTGTGYNAALLCERLGSQLITSVDVDPRLVDKAGKTLRTLGYAPTLAAIDAAAGYPATLPYDRVIATCSFPRIPTAWVQQARPGAVILANLFRSLGAGILVRLVVADEGTAHGASLADTGGFMPTRAETPTDAFPLYRQVSLQDGEARTTHLNSDILRDPDVRFLVALTCTDMSELWSQSEDGPEQYWLLAKDGSWARHDVDQAGEHHVRQGGPRRLWDEVETTHQRWIDLSRPKRDTFGLTVTPQDQLLWLNDPSSAHTWELPI